QVQRRLEEGLEQGITLVMAKAVLALLDAGVPAETIVRTGVGFGTRYREAGWGAGLPVLTAMANVLPHLDPADRALALVAGLAFVARAAGGGEEGGAGRYPHVLAGMIAEATARRPERLAAGSAWAGSFDHDGGVARLAWSILSDDPLEVVTAIDDAIVAGARPEELGRAVAYAAALRITRFHTQNDHADWDEVHHAFTAANALHQALRRSPSPALLRGVYHGALRIYLDRFLNIPAARLPSAGPADLEELPGCWDSEGRVDDAGTIVYRHL